MPVTAVHRDHPDTVAKYMIARTDPVSESDLATTLGDGCLGLDRSGDAAGREQTSPCHGIL